VWVQSVPDQTRLPHGVVDALSEHLLRPASGHGGTGAKQLGHKVGTGPLLQTQRVVTAAHLGQGQLEACTHTERERVKGHRSKVMPGLPSKLHRRENVVFLNTTCAQ
jgi:hypothetical protein